MLCAIRAAHSIAARDAARAVLKLDQAAIVLSARQHPEELSAPLRKACTPEPAIRRRRVLGRCHQVAARALSGVPATGPRLHRMRVRSRSSSLNLIATSRVASAPCCHARAAVPAQPGAWQASLPSERVVPARFGLGHAACVRLLVLGQCVSPNVSISAQPGPLHLVS